MSVECVTSSPLPNTKTLAAIRRDILSWYDANARILPWRIPPGSAEKPDPYRVWLSEVMLQQTTVGAVAPKYQRFLERWPTLQAMVAGGGPEGAEILSEWAGLGYYSRARNLVACAQYVVGTLDGQFPTTAAGLRALPGIGDYTAAAIAAIAFGERAVAIDANVERVVSRLFAFQTPLPAAKSEIAVAAEALWPEAARAGDFAQALMDLGSGPCRARAPDCPACPVAAHCQGFAQGIAAELPRKAPKKAKPERHGRVQWIEREHAGTREVLLVRRPPRGLLGGMRALPGGEWGADKTAAPDHAVHIGAIRHVFTHFSLTLAVDRLPVSAATLPNAEPFEWWPVDQIEAAGLPTVFLKAAMLVLDAPALLDPLFAHSDSVQA